MKLKRLLLGIAKVVVEEAERNPDFERRLAQAVDEVAPKAKPRPRSAESTGGRTERAHRRPTNRRPPAVLDPIQVLREGDEDTLRTRLHELNLEQLRDIVADYGMDPTKLVSKWKDASKVAERILETSVSRVQKGSAFRDPNPH